MSNNFLSEHDIPKTADGNDAKDIDVVDEEETGTGNKGNCRGALPPWRAVYTVVACFLMQLSLGFSYSFGNLLPYLTSYLRHATGDTSLDYSRTLWVTTTYHIVYAGSLLFLGSLERCIPNRIFLLLGAAAFGAALFGTSWAMRQSFPLVLVFYGAFYGIGQTILYPGCVNLPLKWFPKRQGLIGGLVVGGFGGGAFVWNQIVTAWINPHNLQPDQRVGEDLYFTQPEVLDRVPSCFLLLGGIISGLHLLCLLTVAYPPKMTEKSEEIVPGDNADQTIGEDIQMESATEVSRTERAQSASKTSDDEKTKENQTTEYSFLTLIKSRAAWTIWLYNVSFEIGFYFVVSFYKTYGQTFISDDHLLTLVGSFASVFNAVGRPVWGFFADKLGFQPCLLLCQTIIACAAGTFLACEYVGSAMFFVWVCLMYFAISGVYGIFPTIIFALFGGQNYMSNMGFFISTGVISSLLSVFVASATKDALGWHGVFLVGAGCLTGALVLNASLEANCGCPIPQHMKGQLFVNRKNRGRKASN